MRLLVPAVLVLAACASAPAAQQADAVGPEAEVAAAQARARSLPACEAVTADAFAAAPGSMNGMTASDFRIEMRSLPNAAGDFNQSLGCHGVGDDNACTLEGQATVKASVPGRTRWWRVPAGTRVEILSSSTDVTCGVLPAAAS